MHLLIFLLPNIPAKVRLLAGILRSRNMVSEATTEQKRTTQWQNVLFPIGPTSTANGSREFATRHIFSLELKPVGN
jgi:hypothetical protein